MIALITDFGLSDYFVGVVKGVIKAIAPAADIIDVCHTVQPFSVSNAQFILHSAYRYFPAGSIFYVVVDPGVGTGRSALIAADGRYIFILPDNGILSAVHNGDMKVYRIHEGNFKDISSTFHGRDLFAPVAAHLSNGRLPEEYGSEVSNFMEQRFPDYAAAGGVVSGQVYHIDRFGNVIISVPNSEIGTGVEKNYLVKSARWVFRAASCGTYGGLRDRVGLLQGSSGFLEIAMNRVSLSEKYGIRIGDSVEIRHE